MSMEESISLEETNKIRISLGLKPLTDDGGPADTADALAEKNYARKREQENKEKEAKRVFDSIAKIKNKRELHAGLRGRTLGDDDPETTDTLKWIKRSKKKEKELARKRQEELENMDKAFQADYSEKDLEGLKVLHDMEDLQEGEDRILTLKDSRILDNEEDELQNVEMAEHEAVKKANELKIKKPDYTGYDDDEFVEGNIGMKRAVLAKYDEELEGARETGFRLGAGSTTVKRAPETKQEVAAAVNRSLLSIDYAKNLEISDYLQEGDKGFKKPKTKKKRSARVVEADPDVVPNESSTMDVDEKPAPRRQRDLDANFVDDDELQAALARSRRAAVKKAKKLTPEEIAAKIAEERATKEADVKIEEEDTAVPAEEEADGGLVFDETSEFVRAVTYNPAAVKAERPEPRLPKKEPSPERMQVDQPVTELEAGEIGIKEEEDSDDEEMLDQIEDAIRAVEAEERGQGLDSTSSEQNFGSGMASTLHILRQQGILANPTADRTERERVQLQRDAWLAEQRRRLAQREIDRSRQRGSGKDQATREYENRMREQAEARESMDHFKDYKPDIHIVYHDEFGREMTPKEAWKALSHRFHGKGSGKAKTEKRLQRIAEEKKKEAMVSGETPLSMNRAFQIRQEKAGQAHMVLSVGNRGAVPQVEGFIEPQNISKSKAEKKAKKEGKQAAVVDITGFTAPAPALVPIPVLGSEKGSPAPAAVKAGFARIGSASAVENGESTPTPIAGDRTKVAFGLKRKADGEGEGTPPSKRR